MADLIYFLEWPRSGATWFMDYIAECLGYEVVGGYHGEEGPGFCIRIHSYPKSGVDHKEVADHRGFAYEMVPDAKIILFVRDPRDAIISHYFMCARHHGQRITDREVGSLEAYMENVFLTETPPWYVGLPDPYPCDWRRFYEEWLDLYPEHVDTVVRQEDLMADRVGETEKILGFLGYEVDRSILENRITSYLKQQRSPYNKMYKVGKVAAPSIVSGSSCWQYYFQGRSLSMMKDYWQYAEDVLRRLGYEW